MNEITKKFRCSIKTTTIIEARNEEEAIMSFLDGWIDYNDVECEEIMEEEK